MDEWNTNQHSKSGLVKKVKDSKITSKEAEKQTIEFLKEYVNPGGLANVWKFNLSR